ncbi:MucR family transcriptional regulator [Sphingomonas swuensis]|uniref:MucR family transcriptional regulator n=1 Tax=Sphingomonas swuensis TaxID=977800 RepID=UPI003CD090C3
MEQSDLNSTPVELATELTIAWLSNPNTRAQAEEVPAFLQKMHEAVTSLEDGSGRAEASQPEAQHEPAVTVRKSLASRDHLISLIDGKPYKSLRRHLTRHGLTPEQYRERYNLKADYPMVAPAYSDSRREMAKKIGLGNKGRQAKSSTAPKVERTKGTRRRQPKVEAEA